MVQVPRARQVFTFEKSADGVNWNVRHNWSICLHGQQLEIPSEFLSGSSHGLRMGRICRHTMRYHRFSHKIIHDLYENPFHTCPWTYLLKQLDTYLRDFGLGRPLFECSPPPNRTHLQQFIYTTPYIGDGFNITRDETDQLDHSYFHHATLEQKLVPRTTWLNDLSRGLLF